MSRGKDVSDDISAYDLILKNKERLLSLDEPVRFIFSHSALREGWGNPNVFQICSLKQSNSMTQKRQEVGRGLRLCVDSRGIRQDSETTVLNADIVSNVKYDLLGKISAATKLTLKTVATILSKISPAKFAMYKMNPEEFIQKVSRLIQDQKATVIVEHISYNRIEGNYDSSRNGEYCKWCYDKGEFLQDCTMEQMADFCVKFVDQVNAVAHTNYTAQEYRAQLMEQFPRLKRWAK